ncbi:MAG TPA: iron-sulfur cluster assembly protein, partial [Gemmatimonadales bacterium]|nr:iron-sulfur cluster assembly protein [Gemmatimonadales bacterium]
MSAASLKSRVEQALGAITNARQGRDIVAAGMVRDLTVDEQGGVSFTFVLTRDDPGALARQARKAVAAVPGVSGVKVNLVDAGEGGPT